ncbi:MAG TPA: NAD-dependent epimerase/dehydratase family protein, partial [Lacunisphaera sp.]|nr:NAD-dependent epimerase/dehydratase family protein [Lacunisphaera sp.]
MLTVRKNFPVFITGASGFIGGKIAERLLADGRRVRVLSRRPLPELEARGVEVIPGDLHDVHALQRGCASAETVFHVAGRVGVWGSRREFFRVNVDGTRNVIAACREAGVLRLVYTSSPSVVYHGGDLRNVNESAPLCVHAPCAYPTSKAAAEAEVLSANDRNFATIALRPHLVWGPGDKNVIPRVLALARSGRLKIIGSGENKVDVTHITNVVDAHLLAEGALLSGGGVPSPRRDASLPPPDPRPKTQDSNPRPAAGRAFFITNGEPVSLWPWINNLLMEFNEPPVTKRVPLAAAYAAGGVMEALWRVLPLKGEPPMTRFVAKEMATDHWFDISAARRDLGYHPLITV